jgi:8-oxo-dGTP pyrophosphatase MutT (NUDIX family)
MTRLVTNKVTSGKLAGVQFAALPWRMHGQTLQILLVTSRRTHRWIIPKGWPIAKCRPATTAAREAAEEAGVTGDMSKRAIGHFSYRKLMRDGDELPCRVEVFPLKVTLEREDWDEMDARQRKWFSAREAIAAVLEPQLKALIRRFATHVTLERKRKPVA